MRFIAAAFGLIAISAEPAAAGSGTASFGVGATVVAACTVAPRLPAAGAACMPATPPTGMPQPKPVTRLTPDTGQGFALLTLEF